MSRPGNVDWNEENVAKLKQFWDDGRPASYIAAQFPGATRSGILGKIHRLGFKGPRSSDRRPVVKRILKTARKITKSIKQPVEYDPFNMPLELVENPVIFHYLEPHHCRWPVSGDGINTVFCGADKIGRFSYCANHFSMANR